MSKLTFGQRIIKTRINYAYFMPSYQIILNYACKSHHLTYSAAHYHISSCKISASLVKDFSKKGEESEKNT